MSKRTKLVSLLFVLVFAFVSLAGAAFAAVQTAAHTLQQTDTAFLVNGSLDSPMSIAGVCDMTPSCSSGGGG
jgi:hypothetical protein